MLSTNPIPPFPHGNETIKCPSYSPIGLMTHTHVAQVNQGRESNTWPLKTNSSLVPTAQYPCEYRAQMLNISTNLAFLFLYWEINTSKHSKRSRECSVTCGFHSVPTLPVGFANKRWNRGVRARHISWIFGITAYNFSNTGELHILRKVGVNVQISPLLRLTANKLSLSTVLHLKHQQLAPAEQIRHSYPTWPSLPHNL